MMAHTDQKSAAKKKGVGIKSFLPRTLFGRSLLILITPIMLIQIIAVFMFFDRHWKKMTTRLAYAVAGEIAVMANAITFDPDPVKLQRISNYARQHLNLHMTFRPGAEFLPPQEETYTPYTWRSVMAKTLSQELTNELSYPFVLNMDKEEKWIEVYVELDHGLLAVKLPQKRLFTTSGYVFLLWVFASSVILLVIAIIFMRNQVRPIRKLAAAAELFGKGRDAASFRPQGAREIRQAGEAFLNMRRRIKRQVEQRTAMLAGVSHDLRTPLTRLKLQLSMMEQNDDIQAMKDDIGSMEKMITGYLDFVRGDEGEEFEKVSMNNFMNRISGRADFHDIVIHQSLPPHFELMIKPVSFERAVSNLISNAEKFASALWILVDANDEYATFVFEDDGPGIAKEHFEDVFKPFYRVDPSRNPETGGVGLGLSITMDIVHAHGGQIWLEESTYGGLKVTMRIPR